MQFQTKNGRWVNFRSPDQEFEGLGGTDDSYRVEEGSREDEISGQEQPQIEGECDGSMVRQERQREGWFQDLGKEDLNQATRKVVSRKILVDTGKRGLLHIRPFIF